MITLKYSTTNGFLCQVFENSQFIGRVSMEKRMTCDKFLAVIRGKAEEDCCTQEFDTLFDALDWLKNHKGKIKGCDR
jgi:exoribonuclease II